MRCDWPMVPDEESIEPPCEIFLQLFIQNVEIAVGDNPDDNNEDYDDFTFGNAEELNEQDADELIQNFGPILIDSYTDDSDDSVALSLPSTDAELTPSTDEVESETESFYGESHIDAFCSENSPSTSTDARCEEVSCSPNVLDYEYDPEKSNLSDASVEIPLMSDVDSSHSDLTGGSEEMLLLADEHTRRESRSCDLVDEIPTALDTHSRSESKHSNVIDGSEEMSLKTGVYSRESSLDESEAIPLATNDCRKLPENLEATSHSDVIYQNSENYSEISSKDMPLPSKMSPLEDSSVELKSAASNNVLQPSTHVSLYVVVPPTSFSNETNSNLSSEVSTNLSGLYLPISHYSSSFTYDDGNFQLGNILNQNTARSPDSSNVFTSFCTSTMSDTTITKYSQKSNFSDADSVSSNSFFEPKLENVSFENKHSELPLHEETEISASKETSDKYFSSLKRKVNSVDDSILNKVPKYSSQTSSDSINQTSLDCCKTLSNNSESTFQTSHGTEKVDIVPPTVASDVIIKLDNSVERTSVVNEKPKSR